VAVARAQECKIGCLRIKFTALIFRESKTVSGQAMLRVFLQRAAVKLFFSPSILVSLPPITPVIEKTLVKILSELAPRGRCVETKFSFAIAPGCRWLIHWQFFDSAWFCQRKPVLWLWEKWWLTNFGSGWWGVNKEIQFLVKDHYKLLISPAEVKS
jgi:hypothetical protein